MIKSLANLITEDWFLDKVANSERGGILVETKLGEGRTKNVDGFVHGKVPVYLNDGRKVLCKTNNIKVIGFYD